MGLITTYTAGELNHSIGRILAHAAMAAVTAATASFHDIARGEWLGNFGVLAAPFEPAGAGVGYAAAPALAGSPPGYEVSFYGPVRELGFRYGGRRGY